MVLDLAALRNAALTSEIAWQPGPTANSGLSRLHARARLGAVPPDGMAGLQERVQTASARLTAPTGTVASAAAAPAKYDWRKASGGNYVTSVKDQAGCGSCVAFGVVGVLESMVRIAAKQPGLAVDLSEAYAYHCLGATHGAIPCPEGGWWPDEALAAMKAGITDELNYPYTDDAQPCRRGSDWKSRLTKFGGFVRKTSVSSMKTYLSTVGPMVACFTIYEDFFYYYAGGVYKYNAKTSGDIIGGHCVAIVGYDDAKKCWIAKNSWGTGWGEAGYFRIAYGSAGIDAEMWGINGTISSPLIRTDLQVLLAGAGNVYQTGRNKTGKWQSPVVRLDTGTPGDPGAFTAVTATATINRLHVLGLVGGTLWYTRKRSDAGWAKWERPSSTLPSGVSAWDAVSCAAVGDTVQVAGLAAGGIWHTQRNAKGVWQQAWAKAAAGNTAAGKFTALSCVTRGSETNVVAVAGGKLWLITRKKDGSWTAPARINASDGAVPGSFTAVSAATVDGGLNLVALSGGKPWLLERSSSGTWGAFRQLPPAAAGTVFTAVACADVGATLHVLGLAAGKPWHTLRNPDGSWQAKFGSAGGQFTGEPATIVALDGA
ncbi:MAG: C1 family peptidase [Micropruina sp.]|uniref:C1 family peptidase n=1 Tax=Micropruina sp. TaxID=2737536 RepID=UPI0039E24EAB